MKGYLIGADEVGTGAWAGPFLVCAVITIDDWDGMGYDLDDSKKLSPERREQAAAQLETQMHVFGWGWHQDVDRYGMRQTLVDVYRHVLQRARYTTELLNHGLPLRVVVDGDLDLGKGIESIPKADATIPTVMAASILAKVERDRFMRQEVHPCHPQYKFNRHVGYGTAQHLQALKQFGPCAAHRMSYKPLKRLMRERSLRC